MHDDDDEEEATALVGGMGSRNESRGSALTPWITAEMFFRETSSFSASFSDRECSPVAWATKDFVNPKDSLHMKHIRMGLTGTVPQSQTEYEAEESKLDGTLVSEEGDRVPSSAVLSLRVNTR